MSRKNNSVEIRLIFEKKIDKILKIIFAILRFSKKSRLSHLTHQSKDRKLSVKMSVKVLVHFRRSKIRQF